MSDFDCCVVFGFGDFVRALSIQFATTQTRCLMRQAANQQVVNFSLFNQDFTGIQITPTHRYFELPIVKFSVVIGGRTAPTPMQKIKSNSHQTGAISTKTQKNNA